MQKHCKILQYTSSFLFVKIVVSKIINIKATVKWNNNDENNVADTESGVENSIIVLPLTVRVEQMN